MIDGQIKWRIDGDLEAGGIPVVLLNGLMMSISAWQPMVEILRERQAVVRFDFRGQPLSHGRVHRDLLGNVEDLFELLDLLEISRVHLMGTSLGGGIAIEAAARETDRVASVCAVATALLPDAHLREISEGWRRGLRSDSAEESKAFFRRVLVQIYSPAFLERREVDLEKMAAVLAAAPRPWREGVVGLLDAADSFVHGKELESVACPAIVIAGGADRVTTPGTCRRLADALPRSSFEIVPGAGHALILERPGRVTEIWSEFLGRLRRPGTSRPTRAPSGGGRGRPFQGTERGSGSSGESDKFQ